MEAQPGADCWRITCVPEPHPRPPIWGCRLGQAGCEPLLIWARGHHPQLAPICRSPAGTQMLHLMCPSAPPGCPAQDGRRKLTSRPRPHTAHPPSVGAGGASPLTHSHRLEGRRSCALWLFWAAAGGQCRAQAGRARALSRVPRLEQPSGHHLHPPAHAASQLTGARPNARGYICSTCTPSSPPLAVAVCSPATPALSRLSTGQRCQPGEGWP